MRVNVNPADDPFSVPRSWPSAQPKSTKIQRVYIFLDESDQLRNTSRRNICLENITS